MKAVVLGALISAFLAFATRAFAEPIESRDLEFAALCYGILWPAEGGDDKIVLAADDLYQNRVRILIATTAAQAQPALQARLGEESAAGAIWARNRMRSGDRATVEHLRTECRILYDEFLGPVW